MASNTADFGGRGYLLRCQALLFLAGMPILALPMWWGALAASRGYSLVSFGIVQTAAAAGATACGLLLTFLIARINRKWATVFCCALMIAAELTIIAVREVHAVAALRAVFAFGNAGVTGLGWAYLGLTRSPSKSFGWYITFQTIAQATGLFLVPHIADLGGVVAVQSVNATFVAAALIAALGLPSWAPPSSEEASGKAGSSSIPWAPAAAALAAWVLFYLFTNETFSYSERFGTLREIAPARIGLILSITTLLGLPASLAVAAIGERFGIVRPLLLGALLGMVSSGLLLATSTGETGFFLGLAVFSAVWSLNQPYLMAIFAKLDQQGRILVVSQPAQGMAGTALSAGITVLTAYYGLTAVGVTTMVCIAACPALAAVALRLKATRQT
ncbi:MAG: MFS transporter [Chloroflexi bacterium]|nr:MFS transporter [Chloroflexota bacterium]